MCGIFDITSNNKSAKLANIKSITNSFLNFLNQEEKSLLV